MKLTIEIDNVHAPDLLRFLADLNHDQQITSTPDEADIRWEPVGELDDVEPGPFAPNLAAADLYSPLWNGPGEPGSTMPVAPITGITRPMPVVLESTNTGRDNDLHREAFMRGAQLGKTSITADLIAAAGDEISPAEWAERVMEHLENPAAMRGVRLGEPWMSAPGECAPVDLAMPRKNRSGPDPLAIAAADPLKVAMDDPVEPVAPAGYFPPLPAGIPQPPVGYAFAGMGALSKPAEIPTTDLIWCMQNEWQSDNERREYFGVSDGPWAVRIGSDIAIKNGIGI